MESSTKLWQYIYYDQKPKNTQYTSNKYLETSTSEESSTSNQLLLHNRQHHHHHTHHHYSKLQLSFDSDSNSDIKKPFSYKPKLKHLIYLTVILSFVIIFICYKKTSFKFYNEMNNFNNTYQHLRAEQLVNLDERLNSFDKVLTIDTECARYIGNVKEGAFEFLGIQYAVPPLNKLRWKPTIPVWENSNLCKPKYIKKAKRFNYECFQINPFTKKVHGAEDCLYLNIWTPRIDSFASLDVMVYFHPGFLQFGSGHIPGLVPSGSLSKKLNTVFVSFNYRLDGLGFFPLGHYINLENKQHKGNFALYDQLAAVQWVKRNIKQFGGNPNKITVFGADGGAACILALISYKEFRLIINKVWLTGPALFLNKTIKYNKSDLIKNRNDKMETKLSVCKNLNCLKNLTAQEVILGFLNGDEPSFRINDQNDLPIQGIYPKQWILVDNEIVNDAYPFVQNLNYNKLSFLIGTSAQAVEFWPGPNDIRNWTWFEYAKYVSTSLDSFGPTVSQIALHQYPPNTKDFNFYQKYDFFNKQKNSFESQKNLNEINSFNDVNSLFSKLKSKKFKLNDKISPESLYTKMVSDIKQTCPINIISKNLVIKHNSTVFRYIATSEPSKQVKLFGHNSRYGFHLWEMIAFFDQMHLFIDKPTKNDYLFSQKMQNTVLNFLRNENNSLASENFKNNDNSKNLSGNTNKWLSYPNNIALINQNITLVKDYASDRCKFWQNFGLDKYVWIC